jgi:hypothetical protein
VEKGGAMKLSKYYVGEYLHSLGLEKDSLNRTEKEKS